MCGRAGVPPPVLYAEERGIRDFLRAFRRFSFTCVLRGFVLFIPPLVVFAEAYFQSRLLEFRTISLLTILPIISITALIFDIMRNRVWTKKRTDRQATTCINSFQTLLFFSLIGHMLAWWLVSSVFSPSASFERFYTHRVSGVHPDLLEMRETLAVAAPIRIDESDHSNNGGFGSLGWSEERFRSRWSQADLEKMSSAEIVKAHLAECGRGLISVILASHNEHQYAVRTLDSILNSTIPGILREIIIVDDGSSPPMNTSYDAENFPPPLVTILRNDEREGLIRSKVFGGAAALGQVLVFLDAHVRPDPDWWLPILRHIKENPRRVVVPLIPVLNSETWEINRHAVGAKMMFDWDTSFHWFNDDNDWVPCMSGGLLAIHRDWWIQSGELDTGMYVWGGENIEQSIRIWLCGGEIVVARDSIIGHVFRPTFPYSVDGGKVLGNKIRTIEVWFDDYKEFYYQSVPRAAKNRPPFKIPSIAEGGLADIPANYTGPLQGINERLQLRDRLHCKPFQYYVDRFEKVLRDRNMLPVTAVQLSDTSKTMCLTATDVADVKFSAYPLRFENCNENNSWQWWVQDKGKWRTLIKSDACLDAAIGKITDENWRESLIHNFHNRENPETWTKPGANHSVLNHEISTFHCSSPNINQENWKMEQDGKFTLLGGCLIHQDNKILFSSECHKDTAIWVVANSKSFSPADLKKIVHN